MRVARSRPLATLVGVVLTLISCDDATGPPSLGAIHVVVVPAGQDVISGGLRVRLASGALTPPGLRPDQA
jgi:hypothetical protein